MKIETDKLKFKLPPGEWSYSFKDKETGYTLSKEFHFTIEQETELNVLGIPIELKDNPNVVICISRIR
ncbi:MAG TPA: hypothetical protein VKR58_10975 [Aquella sp.]|nr:hypothetical protein [Aquella sp.]